ncbi:T9SS type A sorting domain-containing protein [Phaeocystidibacter luteus]|uniref:T9SS type A sorting domain-containing protein n=1 Tax=Phaeocystidibacter luteus TaxID=911197 RepID=A0A6N6RJR5_9FLAO|nr:T9SS type A sorting domain-containing protein [Phaeocystidibacter luteus]KAB2814364.1 T9SS type A sorting domain-containing protein [Phaeocystidibacter luteus]
MKKSLLLAGLFMAGAFSVQAQTRYVDDVFTDADIVVQSDIVYGVNFSAYVPQSLGGPQVIPLYLDVYMPDPSVDTEQDRPVVMYYHTGSFLPKGLVSPMGARTDSAAVEICKRLAKKGYVAVSATYRLGWQPDNTSNLDLRRGSNLLAVYNAVQDAKNSVRYMRASALQGDPFQIDTEMIMLLGQGSGGYITFAYATLDNYAEVAAPAKFQYQDTIGIFGGKVNIGDPYVDTAVVGDWNGFGGAATITGTNPNGLPTIDFNDPGRNIENIAGVPDNVNLVINLGGALGDENWLEPGEIPMLSVHCVNDFYAPYDSGMVRVPVNGQFWDVVPVAGSFRAIKMANENFNNYVFQRESFSGSVEWQISRSHAANPGGYSGIYPIGIEPADPNLPFAVNANPWDFWDPSDPLGANETNPNNKAQSLAYIDTVMNFIIPGMKAVMDANDISIAEPVTVDFEMYPNPTNGDFRVKSDNVIEEIRILDIAGRVIELQNPDEDDFRISTEGWNPGVYIIQVKSGSLTGTSRLTVY